jgi:O-succinylbenzoic acid--CoA ligase
VITAPALSDEPVITNDVVAVKSETAFEWLGCHDQVINSGGLKIHPEVLESVLAKYLDSAFYITKMPHDSYGETPVIVVENISELMLKNINKANQHIDKPKRIKYIYTAPFAHTHTGKLKKNRLGKL